MQPNPQRGSYKHLQAANLLCCQTILGLKHSQSTNEFLGQGCSIPTYQSFISCWELGTDTRTLSYHKLSFGIPGNAAAPDGMHHTIFCPQRTDSYSLPRWQNQDGCFTTAIPQCSSGTVTPRARQASVTWHLAKQANQPKHPWHWALGVEPGIIAQSRRVELSKYFEQLLISKAALHQLSISQCL